MRLRRYQEVAGSNPVGSAVPTVFVFGGEMYLPGDVIGTVEEAEPGLGVVVEGNELVASLSGELMRKDGKVSVFTRKPIIFSKKGYIVYGMVKYVMDDKAIVEILPSKRGETRLYIPPQDAVLPISKIKEEFVENLNNELAAGDIIKAKILAVRPTVCLTIKEPGLGVIFAFCKNCRSPLRRIGTSTLLCPYCRRRETRKLASCYRQLAELKHLWFL